MFKIYRKQNTLCDTKGCSYKQTTVIIPCYNLRKLFYQLCSPSTCKYYNIHVKFTLFTWGTQMIKSCLKL